MADTPTAEVLRDREPEPEPEPRSQPERTPFGDVASAAMGPYLAAQRKYTDALATRAATVGPQIDAAQQAGADLAARVQANPAPKAPVLPEPPSRGLHAFLAPVQGESPEASVGKFISALSLFATGATGLSKGDARGSLAALKGAMEGWHEGDREKADRGFADWQAKTKSLLTAWDTQRTEWEDWFKASSLPLELQTRGVTLAMLKAGADVDVAKAESEGSKYVLDWITGRADKAADIARSMATIEEARTTRANTEAYRVETIRQGDERLDLDRQKLAAAEKQQADLLNSATPEALAQLGKKYFLGEPLPPNIARGKNAGLMMKIVDAGLKWAEENGIDPGSSTTIKADLEASRKALVKLRSTTVTSEAQAARFDTHLDAAVQLSEKIDDTGSPVWNRLRRKAAGTYGGDAGVARLEAQLFEVAMEYARLTVGTAQGDQATREEARRMLNAWMTHPQLTAIAQQLKDNAHNNVANNRAQERQLVRFIDTVGDRIAKPEAKPADVKMPNDAPGAGAIIRYKRDASGALVIDK